MTLDALPLTSSGKVDRHLLPAAPPGTQTAYVAPRTPVEKLVAGVWQGVLGVDRVGLDADFFELGGHSLLATLVVSRLRDALGVELPLRTIFEAHTVSALAMVVTQELAEGEDEDEVARMIAAIQQVPAKDLEASS